MNYESAIKRASELAYEEDMNQVVGRDEYHGWIIANSEDEGTIANLSETVTVDSSGVVED